MIYIKKDNGLCVTIKMKMDEELSNQDVTFL